MDKVKGMMENETFLLRNYISGQILATNDTNFHQSIGVNSCYSWPGFGAASGTDLSIRELFHLKNYGHVLQ